MLDYSDKLIDGLADLLILYFTELDLSSCRLIPPEAFEGISKLTELTSLNLYRTTIPESATCEIIR